MTGAAVLAGLWLAAASMPAGPQQPMAVQPQAGAGPEIVLPPRVGVEGGQPLRLTLAEAIRLTLEQNNDVVIARLEVDAARQDIRAAEGVFDPRVLPAFSFQRTVSANTSAIGGAVNGRLEQDALVGGLGMEGRAPWAGGRFTVDFSSSRLKTSNQFARLNPQFPSAFGASYVQPLFRGRTIDPERREILLARRAADLTDRQLAQLLMDQLTLVEQAYWDLVFAAENLDIQTTALRQAMSQVASNERQVTEGTLAPIDVVEAQTQAATFRQTVASAQQALTEAENRLKSLMLASRESPEWSRPIVPSEVADRPGLALPLDEAVMLALARRPELSALDTVRAQNEVDREFFSDQARPQFDVVGAYTLSGLAGASLQSTGSPIGGSGSDAALLARLNELSARAGLDELPTPPPTGSSVPEFLIGSYGDSLSNLFSRRYPTAFVQLQMELPIGNSTARANLARTRIAGAQIARQRQQLEQAIQAQVRNSLQAVQSSQQRLDAASSARRNALEQYESERRRFESGLSTVFLVLQRQTSLVTAQARELRARADLNQAVSLFERAVGGTLERHGVRVGSAIARSRDRVIG
jgi:HAE1 family hydrophobic/amphiphilic exporter-1